MSLTVNGIPLQHPPSGTRPAGRRGTALVTGASTGIGLELARLLAAGGYDLVIISRNRPQLEAVAAELVAKNGVTVHVLDTDLALSDAPDTIFQQLQDQRIEIDMLVNNAGFGSQGPFAGADLVNQLQMVQVNVTALTHLTRLFLPAMIARRRGRVLNVASTAAFQPGPLMAVYYATKAYVLSFSQAIAHELRHTGVTVTALCPGPTATEFNKRGNIRKTRLFKGTVMDAATVARAGYQGMLRGKRVVIPGLRNRVLIGAGRFAPARLVLRVARKLNEAK